MCGHMTMDQNLLSIMLLFLSFLLILGHISNMNATRGPSGDPGPPWNAAVRGLDLEGQMASGGIVSALR